MFATLTLIAVTALTLRFAVAEGLITLGRIGGGMSVTSLPTANPGRGIVTAADLR